MTKPKPKKAPVQVKHLRNNWKKLLPEEKEELLPKLKQIAAQAARVDRTK